MFLNHTIVSVSYFHTIFARKHVVFLKILYCLKKICTTAGRDEFQVSAVTTVMNSFFCRRWESFSIFSNTTSRHLFDCDWNGLAATTGIISYITTGLVGLILQKLEWTWWRQRPMYELPTGKGDKNEHGEGDPEAQSGHSVTEDQPCV